MAGTAFELALAESDPEGRVRGALNLGAFVSWHDGRLSDWEQFLTLVHEDLHAKSISGTHFQTNLLSNRFNAEVDEHPPAVPTQFTDFVEFHESHPMAFDLLTGLRSSHYEQESIRQIASTTADLASRLAALIDFDVEGSELLVLRSIYLAFSDLYTDRDAGRSTTLIAMLHEIVATAEAGGRNPFGGMDRSRDLSPQLSMLISTELRERHGVTIVHLGDELRAAFAFAWMAGPYFRADEESVRRVHRRMFMPTMNYLFDGVLIPHGVLDPDARTLTIASTELLYTRPQRASDGDHPFRRSYDNHRRSRFASRQTFVFESFFAEDAHLDTSFTDAMIYPQLSRTIAQFPAALCLLADELFVRSSDGERKLALNDLHEYMSAFVPYWELIRANYPALRGEIGRSLGEACADMPHWMTMTIVDFVQQYSDRFLFDADVSGDTLHVFMGDQLLYVPRST